MQKRGQDLPQRGLIPKNLSSIMPRLLTQARDQILQRRYGAKSQPPRRIIALWPRDVGGFLQVLQGHASRHLTRDGRLYRTRTRLVKRIGLSAFVRKH